MQSAGGVGKTEETEETGAYGANLKVSSLKFKSDQTSGLRVQICPESVFTVPSARYVAMKFTSIQRFYLVDGVAEITANPQRVGRFVDEDAANVGGAGK